jgi:hypothetical protein
VSSPPLRTRLFQLPLERVWAITIPAQASCGLAEKHQFLVRHPAQTCAQLFEFVAGFNWGLHLDDGEIQDATTIATLCVVLLAGNFLAGQGHLADCERIETLAADYANRVS